MLNYLSANLEPLRVLFSFRPIPWSIRWRTLLFLPGFTIINSMKYLPWIFSREYSTLWIPSRDPGRKLRCIVFQPRYTPSSPSPTKPRPLHITVHGGAFMGGIAEMNAEVASKVCKETGAVTVSLQYRGSPRYTFPAGHDDVHDAFAYWVSDEAKQKYNLDLNNVTVSGLSAGGNYAISGALSQPGKVKASVTFYAAVDLRLPPWEKPKGPDLPEKDPMAFMLPVFDSYVGPERQKYIDDARLHVTLGKAEDLPHDMLLFIPTGDILVDEQTEFVERVRKETEGTGRRIESVVYKGDWHGWAELPDFADKYGSKKDAFRRMIEFLKESNENNGWKW